MPLQDSLRDARTKFDTTLQLVDTALSTQEVMRDLAHIEARNVFHQYVGAIFDTEFNAVLSSAASNAQKLPLLTQQFAAQKASYEAVFADIANRELCRNESISSIEKAFRAVLA